jgi:hypothetical protein
MELLSVTCSSDSQRRKAIVTGGPDGRREQPVAERDR